MYVLGSKLMINKECEKDPDVLRRKEAVLAREGCRSWRARCQHVRLGGSLPPH